MPVELSEWLKLALRWAHVVAGIMWVGQTYFFTWMDGVIHRAAAEGSAPLWMVHSGGFYIVNSEKAPKAVPKDLHWFRWEAAITWLSGIALLTMVYYAGGLLVDDTVLALTTAQAVGMSAGMLVAAWYLYDLIWRSPLARHPRAGAVVSLALVIAFAFALSKLFAGRAAYMQVGATFGTLMAGNVWLRILPAQRSMIASIHQGQALDLSQGAGAKTRSKHNTYMSVPLIFIMVSSHFPTVSYGHAWGWLILGGLVLVGFAARALMFR